MSWVGRRLDHVRGFIVHCRGCRRPRDDHDQRIGHAWQQHDRRHRRNHLRPRRLNPACGMARTGPITVDSEIR
ncbi:MAG TPA: hypothetical protein DEA66_00690 [Flavobacteriales bacterium]|nr:hypothetical protein [Flavobacteriales bacterium]HCL46014.1 hypothetical protein [Flavobacteriales bacterium]